MSTVDERVVQLQFNNGQFESGVQQSIGTLQRLKGALDFGGASKGLKDLQKTGNDFNLSHVSDSVDKVAERFTFLGNLVENVRNRISNSVINMGRNLLTAIPNQIISGGKKRAQTIEQAQFQLKGLLKEDYNWDVIKKDLDVAVSGTRFGLDAAAQAAAQLKASNINFGEDMQTALRGISGVASMTNSSYEDISHIFTKIAGQGKVMTEELNQFAGRGLNVAAELANRMGVTEQKLREMVTQGKVDFKTFAKYMNEAFGDQATKANDTFTGALSNVKASLSRMGEQFATPAYENMRKVLVALIPVLKDVEAILKKISPKFAEMAENVSAVATGALEDLHFSLKSMLGGVEGEDFSGPIDGVTKAVSELHDAMVPTLYKPGEFPLINQTELLNKQVEKTTGVYEAAEKAYEEIEKKRKAAIDAGKDEVLVNKQAKKAIEDVRKMVEDNTKEITLNTTENGKMSKGEQKKQEILKKSIETAQNLRNKVFDLFGIEKKENEQVAENAKQYKGLEELAGDVIMGKYGNGEERKKKLEELGFSYAIIQNKVNELLGVEKRHAVTEEDEAKMAKLLGESVGETGEEAKKTETTFTKLVNILAGFRSAMSIVVNLGSALITHIIRPFLSWALPKVLSAILTPLSAIGKVLVDLNQKIQDTDFFNVKLKALADWFVSMKDRLASFWESVKQLEGVKNLVAAFNNLKTTVETLWKALSSKLLNAFNKFKDSLHFTEKDSGGLLMIINDLANGLAKFVNFMADNALEIAKFFEPLFDWILALGPRLIHLWDLLGGFTGLRATFKPIVNFLVAMGDALKTFWDTVTSGIGFKGLFKNLAGEGKVGIVTAFQTLFGSIGTAFSTLGKELKTKFGNILRIIGGTETGKKVLDFLNKITAPLKAAKDAVANFFQAANPLTFLRDKLNDIFGDKSDTKIKGFGTTVLGIFAAIKGGIGNFIGFVSRNAGTVGDFFKPLFDWLISLGPKIKGLWETLGGFQGIKTAFASLASWFANIGSSFKTFWESITNNAGLKGLFANIAGNGKTRIIEAFRTLFTSLGNSFGTFGQAIKEKFSSLFAIIGRSELGQKVMEFLNKINAPLTAAKNAIVSFFTAANPIASLKEKLIGLFGDDIGEKIRNFKDAFVNLFASFRAGNPADAIRNLWNAFKDLFSGFSIESLMQNIGNLGETVSSFFKNLFMNSAGKIDLTGILPDFGSSVFRSALGRVGQSLQSSLRELGLGSDIFAAVDPKTAYQDYLSKVEAETQSVAISTDGSGGGFNLFGWLINAVKNIGTVLMDKGQGIITILKGLGSKIATAFKFENLKQNAKNLITTVGNLGENLIKSFSFVKLKTVLKGSGIAMLVSQLARLLIFFKGFRLSRFLGDIGSALQAFTMGQKSQTMLNFAKAIGIVTASLIALTFVDHKKLVSVIGAIAALVAVVGVVVAVVKVLGGLFSKDKVDNSVEHSVHLFENLFDAFKGAANYVGMGLMMIGLAVALQIIAKAIQEFIDIKWEDAGDAIKHLQMVMLGLAIVIPVMAILSRIGNGEGLLGLGLIMVGLAAGLWALSQAIPALKEMDDNAFHTIIDMLLVLFVGLAALAKVSGGSESSSLPELAKGLLILCAALFAFKYVLDAYKDVEVGDMIPGILAFAVAIAGLSYVAQTVDEDAGNSLLKMAAALLILAPALIMLGNSFKSGLLGVVGMGAALVVLAGAMWVIKKLDVAETFNEMSEAMLNLATAMLILGVAAPLLAEGLVMLGNTFIDNAGPMIIGFGLLITALLVLAGVAKLVGAPIALLGGGLLALVVSIGVLVGKLGDFEETFGGITETFGGFAESMTDTFGSLAESLGLFGKGMDGFAKDSSKYQTALDKYHVALGKMDFLDSSVATELDTKMAELKTMDGSKYSIELQNVLAYIKGLGLDRQETEKLLRTTTETALADAKENFTAAIDDLQIAIHNLHMSPEDEDLFWSKVENLINTGYDPSRRKLTFTMDSLRNEVQRVMEEAGFDEQAITIMTDAVQEAAVAAAEEKVALEKLNLVLEGADIDDNAKQMIQDEITGYMSNETFNGKAALKKINAIIDDPTVNMTWWEKKQLRDAISDYLSADTTFKFSLAKVKVALKEAGVDENDTETFSAVQDAITELGTKLSTGEWTEDSNEYAVRLEGLKVFLRNAGIDPDAIDNIIGLVQEAANKKSTQLIAFNKIMAYGKEYKISQSVMSKIQEQLNAVANDPKNPIKIQKLYASCKEADMSDEDIEALFTSLENEVNAGIRKEIAIHNLHFAYDYLELSDEDRETMDGIVQAALEAGEWSEEDIEYEKAVNIIYKASVDPKTGVLDETKYNYALQQLNNALNQGADVWTASLANIGIVVGQAHFATETDRLDWKKKVEDLLAIQETDPISLPTKVKEFLLDLEDSTISDADFKVVKRMTEELLNTYETAYNEQYSQIRQRMEKLRRKEVGGAEYADATGSGVFTYKGAKLNKQIEEFWSQYSAEDLADDDSWDKAFQKFSDFLFKIGATEQDFYDAFGGGEGLKDGDLMDYIQKAWAGGDIVGPEGAVLRSFMQGLIESMLTGGSEELKDAQIVEAYKVDILGILEQVFGPKVTDEAQKEWSEALDELASSLSDEEREKLYGNDDMLNLNDLLNYFFTDAEGNLTDYEGNENFKNITDIFENYDGDITKIQRFLHDLYQSTVAAGDEAKEEAEEVKKAEEEIEKAAIGAAAEATFDWQAWFKESGYTNKNTKKVYNEIFSNLPEEDQSVIRDSINKKDKLMSPMELYKYYFVDPEGSERLEKLHNITYKDQYDELITLAKEVEAAKQKFIEETVESRYSEKHPEPKETFDPYTWLEENGMNTEQMVDAYTEYFNTLPEHLRSQIEGSEDGSLSPIELFKHYFGDPNDPNFEKYLALNTDEYQDLFVMLTNLQAMITKAKAAHDTGTEEEFEFNPFEWLETLTTPSVAEVKEKYAKKEEEALEEVEETIVDVNSDLQKDFFQRMMAEWNPEGFEDEAGYANWFDGIIKSMKITDENGNPITMDYIMQKIEEQSPDLTIRGKYNPTQWLADRIHAALQNPELQQGNLANLFYELMGTGFSNFNGEGWLQLRNGEEEIITSNVSQEIKDLFETGVEQGVESAAPNATISQPTQLVLDESARESGAESGTAWGESFSEAASASGSFNFDGSWSPGVKTDQLDPKSIFGVDSIADGIKEGAQDSAPDVKEVVGGLWEDALDPDAAEEAAEAAGETIPEGAADGVTGKAPLVDHATENMFEHAILTGKTTIDSASPSKVFMELGGYMAEGTEIGVIKGTPMVVEAVRRLMVRCINEATQRAAYFTRPGMESADRFAAGILAKIQAAYYAAASLVENAVSGGNSRLYRAEQLGKDFGDGYVRGVKSKVQDAYNAGGELAKAAEEGDANTQKSNSPSKVAQRLGNYFGMGYVNGMMEFSQKVHDTAGDLAATAIDTLRSPMQIVQDLLESDLDPDPTITPVMDLTGIQNGVKRINGMMPDTGISLGYISSSMNRPRTTNEDVVAAIGGLSKQMGATTGNVYNVNGVTYDDGSNIATAVQDLVRAARVERRR